MRIFPGLVSITFRKLSPEEIIRLASDCDLSGIEWGGDVHVPHGNTKRAAEIAKRSLDAGLMTAAYGSYYRAACSEKEGLPFEEVLETAVVLEAPTIRVWAGCKGSDKNDPHYFEEVVADLDRIGKMAVKAGCTVSLEFHADTLTDCTASARRLLESLPSHGVQTYWQPPVGASTEEAIEGLLMVLPRLSNVHVFHWEGNKRRPLSEGAERWAQYFQILRTKNAPRWALLEFVENDDPAVLAREAATLRKLLKS